MTRTVIQVGRRCHAKSGWHLVYRLIEETTDENDVRIRPMTGWRNSVAAAKNARPLKR